MAAAEAAESSSRSGSSSASTGDSYIGSVISLTSKCEIRYEGVLYNINTLESSIGLRNVRSFGTEGRKKDGPQIPASEKIYEYILFRGSDIKDLQVKSSPSAPIHNDPAIIQSHYSRPPPSSTSFPSVPSGNVPELSSNSANVGLPRSSFQGNLPLYQPTANGSTLAVQPPVHMYWQGYYPPSFIRPPPGVPIHQSMQPPLQNQNLLEFPSPLFPTLGSTLSATSASTLPSTLAPPQASSLLPEASPSQMPTNISFMPKLTSGLESIQSLPQNVPASVSNNPRLVPTVNASYQTAPQSTPSIVGSSSSNQIETSTVNASFTPQLVSNSESSFSTTPNLNYQTMSYSVPSTAALSNSSQVETSGPLVTPVQLLKPSLSVVSSSPPLQSSTKEVEVKPQEAKTKPSIPEAPILAPPETKEPILPLPTPTPTYQKSNGSALHTHQVRGRGRGRGNMYPRPVTKFNEDFDFTAMNEKFNKDEVWGHLGKNKSQLRDEDEDDDDEDESFDEDGNEPSKFDKKPVYVKDDFFDTLSSNTLDRESGNGRMRFSEQLKIDAETFGDVSRHGHRAVRGAGRGFGYRGGRTRGSYYGRGYGYGGRGRGQMGPYRPF